MSLKIRSIPWYPVILNALAYAAIVISLFFVPAFGLELKLSNGIIAWSTTAYAVAIVCTGYLAGWSSDRWGRKPFIRAGFFVGGLAFAAMYWVDGAAGYVLVRALIGVAYGCYGGALAAYASEGGVSLGAYSGIASLGATIGLLLSGWLAGRAVDSRRAFIVGSLLMAIAFAGSRWLGQRTSGGERSRLWPLPILRKNWRVYLAALLRHTGASALWVLWTVYLNALHADNMAIGVINATNNFVQFLAAFILLETLGGRRALRIGLFLSGVSFLVILLPTSAYWMVPTQVVLGVSWTWFYAGSLKVLAEDNPTEQGAAIGMLSSTLQMSYILGTIASTTITGMYAGLPFIQQYHHIIYFGAALAFISWVVALRTAKPEVAGERPLAGLPGGRI